MEQNDVTVAVCIVISDRLRVVGEWKQSEVQTLLDQILAVLPNDDNVKYSTMADRLEWDTVRVGQHTPAECKEHWLGITTKVLHTSNGRLSGTTRVSWYQKVKPVWILLKQETVSNKCVAVRKVSAPLRELICHMGSHSVTCHPAEVTFPPLPQPKLVLD